MTTPTDPSSYPPPDAERVERALVAMRTRRARLRRARAVAVSGTLVVALAIVVVASASSGSHRLRVTGPSSSSTTATSITTATSSTSATSTTTTEPGTTATAAPAGTEQIVYRPFTESGVIDPGLRVTSRVTGTCVTGETSRTYRCFGVAPAGGIYDPCFVVPRAPSQTFVCPSDPATPDVIELTATAPASGPPVTTNRPWAFQLSSGEVCLFVSAAWGGLGPYDCQRNDPSVVPADCRPATSSPQWWTADCQDDKTDASPFTPKRVTKVWF